MKTILSIDGGGIRGIIPATLLAKIEQITRKPAGQLFDMIAGTSTGGILALALAKPDGGGSPQYPAEELIGLYEEHGPTIFRRKRWRRILAAANLFDEKYSAAGLESVLERYFGEERLSAAVCPLLVTSYEIERRFPFFFRSSAARRDVAYDFPMKLVGRATSAAPTYFEPLKIETGDAAGYYALVDGGLYANNPAMCALVEARRLFGEEPLLVVSLGTGALTRPIEYEQACRWGVARWAKPVLEIAFDGVSSTVHHQLQQMLARSQGGVRHYYRFQPVLDAGLQDMDDASGGNVRRLKLLAESLIRDRREELETLCETLAGRG